MILLTHDDSFIRAFTILGYLIISSVFSGYYVISTVYIPIFGFVVDYSPLLNRKIARQLFVMIWTVT